MKIEYQIVSLEYLKDQIGKIDTIDDFAEFVHKLISAERDGAFEPQSVYDYLEGLLGYISSISEGANPNFPRQEDKEPSWPLFATLLLAAFYHS